MVAQLRIQDGSPIWLSNAIIPSTDTVISPGSSPSLATIQVGSTNVFVYVKVDNIGDQDLGATCPCGTGAWAAPITFPVAQFVTADPGSPQVQNQPTGTYRFRYTTAALGGDIVTPIVAGGGISHSFGHPTTGRRTWAWSADGKFFAYVTAGSLATDTDNAHWELQILALQNITLSDGTVLLAGQVITASGTFGANWTNTNFSLAGSKAILASGPDPAGGTMVRLACPESPVTNVWSGNLIAGTGLTWLPRISPCASVVAFMPQRATAAAAAANFRVVSTANAAETQFRQMNIPLAAPIAGTPGTPAITTNTHGINGVTVDTGGTNVMVDDPDCTFVGGGVRVHVDRVKASTLPSANLGVLSVGTAALGLSRVNSSYWVQVPNQNTILWDNQGEQHWCLLAQSYTPDGTTIPSPWDGQAATPPPFPVSLENCAQRNIGILP